MASAFLMLNVIFNPNDYLIIFAAWEMLFDCLLSRILSGHSKIDKTKFF